MRYKKRVLAPLFMIVSALSFALMSAAVKQAVGVPFIQKVFFRNFIILIVIIPAMLLRFQGNKDISVFIGNRGTRKLLLARSLIGVTGVLLYFYSVERLPLGDSAILNKLSAFFIMLTSALFLKERIKRFQIPALLAAFSGALLIIRPGFNMQVVPAVVGVTAAFTAAVAYSIIAVLKGKEDSLTIIFWFSAISVTVTAVPVIIGWENPSFGELVALILTGVFAAGGQYFLTLAYTYGPAVEVSIYNYTQVVFSMLIGIMMWREVPDVPSLAGATLIIGAAYFLYLRGRRNSG